jgi:signal transduction histidine kinase
MRIGLAGVVDETVRVFAAGLSGCAVRVELGEGAADAELDGDPAQLRQVLWNLVRNAAEAMPGGGTIVVSLARDGGAVELAVSDEGQGITPEDQEHVFEPFFTTKKGGTGLGLAMVQRVVLEHGGQVGLSSQAGKGTRVAVRLPVAAASAAAM